MANTRITAVLSQTRSKNPVKRHMEEEIATALLMEPRVDFAVVPHIYDLYPGDTGLLYLSSITGHLVVLSWLYPRAAHWVLDRNGIKGKVGVTTLKSLGEEGDDETDANEEKYRGIGTTDAPNRSIFCLDLRAYEDPQIYVNEIKRIAQEAAVKLVPLQGLAQNHPPVDERQPLMSWIQGSPNQEQLHRFLEPQKDSEGLGVLAESRGHRWYPVIDYTRCTNCLECIDFCLFGVYGIDKNDTILVESQDNCKRGCPACSRVCPENAIIFPEHKSPAIAGAPGEGPGGLKIDLSRLFGGSGALHTAVHERDAELLKDGRQAVGLTVGIPKRHGDKAPQEKDDLDKLMDDLDNFTL